MKLVLILVLIVLSVMAVTGTYLLNQVAEFYNQKFVGEMKAVFTPGLFDALRKEAPNGADKLHEILKTYGAQMGISEHRDFYILDAATGDYIAGTNPAEGPLLEKTENIITAMTGSAGESWKLSNGYSDWAVPVSPEGEANLFIIYVRDSNQEASTLMSRLFIIIFQAVSFGLVISILLSFLLSKTMATPIENLTRSVRQVAEGNFGSRLPVQSRDEVGMLTQAYNNMTNVLRDTLNEIENERDKLQMLFLRMSDGVLAFDSDGVLIHINPAARDLLSIYAGGEMKYADLLGKAGINFEDLLDPKPDGAPDLDWNAGEKHLQLSFAPFGVDEDRGVIVVIRDLTEIRRLDAARREFVANVSHELRTPLTNIKTYTETLIDNPGLEGETAGKFERVILSETDRMTRLVRDLLSLSRLDSHQMEWDMGLVDLEAVAAGTYEAMSGEARRLGHEFELEIEGSLPVMTGDRQRIEQVLVNILQNAFNYTPGGGNITMRAWHNPREGMCVFAVEDNGIGVPEEDIPKLFERFYRVDKARSRENGGTGLGLAIARDIVRHHGGDISVVSKYGKGTTVTVKLPVPDSDGGRGNGYGG